MLGGKQAGGAVGGWAWRRSRRWVGPCDFAHWSSSNNKMKIRVVGKDVGIGAFIHC